MDILAKHAEPDEHGARIAQLDEMGYRTRLWDHQPLTDFWRVGPGYAKKLASVGLHTMGDIARCSLGRPDQYHNPALLYRLFGVNAELLIDHAWGWEPCTIRDIKSYVPQSASLSSGQVLFRPYGFEEALLIAREMADALSLQLVEKGLVTDQLVLTVGYDRENLTRQRDVPAVLDRYGRAVPRSAHGSIRPEEGFTSSTKALLRAVGDLFRRIVDPALTVRRLYLAANHVRPESAQTSEPAQLSLFEGPNRAEQQARERERRQQQTVLALQKRFGKNAVVRGMNLQQASTARQRNEQVGGHRKG